MSEKFHENYVERKEKPKDFSDTKNKIKKQAIDFYKKNLNNSDSIQNLKTLLTNQNGDKLKSNENFSNSKIDVIKNSKRNLNFLKIQNFENIVKLIKENLIDIQKTKDNNTNFTSKSLDGIIKIFGGESNDSIYKNSFDRTREHASKVLVNLAKQINFDELSNEEKLKVLNIKNEVQSIFGKKLENTGIIKLTENELSDFPENIKLAINGVKGEVIGILKGTKNIIIGSFDLLKFFIKFPLSKEYRKEINDQVSKILDFCSKNGFGGIMKKVGEILKLEIERVGKLPKEKQAQAIGEIAGNVISMLMLIKGVKIGTAKYSRIFQTPKLIPEVTEIGSLAKLENIRQLAIKLANNKLTLQAFNTLLGGVAETILFKGISISIREISIILRSVLPKGDKIKALEKMIIEVSALKTINEDEDLIKSKFIETLETEKKKLVEGVENVEKGKVKTELEELGNKDYKGIDYKYESPIKEIEKLLLKGDLEKAKKLLITNIKRFRIFGDDINSFDKYIREGNFKEALKLFKEAEKRTIEDFKKIGFSIEDNEKFYKSLKEGDVDEIKRLYNLSKERLKVSTGLEIPEDTYTKYGMKWTDNKTEIINKKSFTEKEKIINPFTNKKELLSREDLHNLIINHFIKEIQNSEKPTILVFGGISGSGKSSVMAKEKLISKYINVNPDEIKKFLPEFNENNSKTVSLVHNESTHIGDKIFELAIKGKSDIIIENTMSYLPSIKNYLQINNYEKKLIFVFSGAEAWKRNTIDRARMINPEGFLNQFKAFENVVTLMKSEKVKNLKIYSNMGKEGEEILIYEKVDGKSILGEYNELKELENFAKIAKKL